MNWLFGLPLFDFSVVLIVFLIGFIRFGLYLGEKFRIDESDNPYLFLAVVLLISISCLYGALNSEIDLNQYKTIENYSINSKFLEDKKITLLEYIIVKDEQKKLEGKQQEIDKQSIVANIASRAK